MRYNSKIIFLIVSRKRMKIKKWIIRNHGKRNIRKLILYNINVILNVILKRNIKRNIKKFNKT